MMTGAKFHVQVLCRGILAGIMIGIGGIVYLSVESKIAGAFLFSIGLFVICSSGFSLFTGKVGCIVNNGLSYIKELSVIICGNLIGTYFTALLIRHTRLSGVAEKAASLSEIKLSDDLLSIFILAAFCGALMYLGVEGYKMFQEPLAKYLSIFLAVMVFILSGFEHCVANMFYFSAAGVWSLRSAAYMLVMIFGNSAGALFFSHMNQVLNG